MKKSILSVFVTLAMLFSFMPAALADNSNAAYELVPDTYTVAQGDNVTFAFNVKNVELAGTIGAKLVYDPEKLVYVSSSFGNIRNYDYVSNTGTMITHDATKNAVKALLTFKEDAYHDVNDTFFTVTFMVAADLEPGDYSDYITVEDSMAIRGLTMFDIKGSVPEMTVVKGDATQPLLVTANKTSVAMGEDITYTISALGETELNALQILLDYDKSMLEFKEGTLAEGATSEVNEDGIVWANGDVVKFSGEIATLTFTALKNGVANITASAESGPVNVKATFPSVTIVSDVSLKVTADKKYVSAGDTLTYTVSTDKAVALQGLQLDLDFSRIHIEDCKAEVGGALANVGDIARDAAFNNNVATIVFANSSLAEIPAGVLAKFSLKLSADLPGTFRPEVTDSSATYGTDESFTADVSIDAVDPTPVTAFLTAVPNVAYVQAGDVVTYTVSINKAIYPIAFEAHMNIDPQYVDGAVTVKSVSSTVQASYNAENKDITAVGFNNGNQFEVSGKLFTVTFKTKAEKNTQLTPAFSDIVVSGASVSGSASPITIFAEGSARIDISSSPSFALPGSTVTYKFDLRDAKALKILQIDMSYDPAKYVDATVKVADVSPLTANTTVDKESGIITVTMLGENALSGDKSGIVTVEFKVADSPETGADGVTVDVKSDEYTTLEVTNYADTRLVTNYADLVVDTDTTYVLNAPEAKPVEVTVAINKASDLSDLSFELTYDKSKFIKISGPEVMIDGAQCSDPEEGRMPYVMMGADIDGDATLMTFKLYPLETASGAVTIEAKDVATTSAIDTAKASKTIYLFSKEETSQIITVRNAINAIGEITADNYKDKEPEVQTARALYTNLSELQKNALVNEAAVLKAAEDKIAEFYYAAMKNFKVTVTAGEDGYTATIVNQKEVSDDPAVVIAVYDKDDLLVGLTSGKASAASIVAAADTANTTVKVYVWNSMGEMIPYTDVEIVY